MGFCSLAHGPSANMEGVAFMTDTAASHRGAIEMFWLNFGGALILSIFIQYTVYEMYIFFHSLSSCCSYMVDAADPEKIEASKNELHNLLDKPQLQGIPVRIQPGQKATNNTDPEPSTHT